MDTATSVPTPQKRRFVSIIGLSDERRIPRLGRIRLGHVNHNTISSKSYPEEDAFFHVPAEVARAYNNEKPTELDILFPVNDRSIIFPQAYEYYGGGKRLLCSGNGREAMRWDPKQLSMQPTECPCNLLGDGCKQRAHLLVMLPKVNQTGVYQIDTSSLMSIININSFLHMLAPDDDPDAGLLGFFAMIPMKLRRVPRDIYPKGYHRKTYPLELALDVTEEQLQDLRARKNELLLPTRRWKVQDPEQVNPEHDTGAIITIDGKNPAETDGQATATDEPTSPPTGPTASTEQPAATNSEASASSVPPQPATDALQAPAAPAEASVQPLVTHATSTPPQSGPSSGTQRAPVTPLRPDHITGAQRNRILSKTRAIQIPDDVVDTIIGSYTKKQASELINQIDRGDFSAFERREMKDVPLPAAV